MIYTIRIMPKAQNDYREIKNYISKDNLNAAEVVINYISSCIDNLKIAPSSGKYGQAINTRELVLNKYPYKIIYRIEGGEIQILRIYHTSRKWSDT